MIHGTDAHWRARAEMMSLSFPAVSRAAVSHLCFLCFSLHLFYH